MLESLAFHARDRFDVVRRIVVLEELADLVLHEAGQFEIEGGIGLLDLFDEFSQIVLVKFGQLRETVVGEEVGEFLGFRAVGLLVHRHGFATDEEGGLKTTVTTHNESAPLRDSDGIAPALVLDD